MDSVYFPEHGSHLLLYSHSNEHFNTNFMRKLVDSVYFPEHGSHLLLYSHSNEHFNTIL